MDLKNNVVDIKNIRGQFELDVNIEVFDTPDKYESISFIDKSLDDINNIISKYTYLSETYFLMGFGHIYTFSMVTNLKTKELYTGSTKIILGNKTVKKTEDISIINFVDNDENIIYIDDTDKLFNKDSEIKFTSYLGPKLIIKSYQNKKKQFNKDAFIETDKHIQKAIRHTIIDNDVDKIRINFDDKDNIDFKTKDIFTEFFGGEEFVMSINHLIYSDSRRLIGISYKDQSKKPIMIRGDKLISEIEGDNTYLEEKDNKLIIHLDGISSYSHIVDSFYNEIDIVPFNKREIFKVIK